MKSPKNVLAMLLTSSSRHIADVNQHMAFLIPNGGSDISLLDFQEIVRLARQHNHEGYVISHEEKSKLIDNVVQMIMIDLD